ncbi:hypothetical protein JYT74_00680 [Crocinitomix catalasitica]|nr:hypothetical protein [Crocinitomix catalasitica]
MITYLIISLCSFGQESGEKLYDHDLDENKWEKLRQGIRYEGAENGPGRQWTYESQEDYNKAREKYGDGSGGGGGGDGSGQKPQNNPPPQSSPPSISSPGTTGFGVLGYILMIAMVIGLMVLIYYMFINSQRHGRKITKIVDIEDLNPTEIPLSELQRLLQEALDKDDYRGAVRIYFIFIIRDLADKRWIKWEKEKTNFHYLREMSGMAEFDDFNRSVSYFEIIWYGKREIDSVKFEQVRPNFTRFLEKLGVE